MLSKPIDRTGFTTLKEHWEVLESAMQKDGVDPSEIKRTEFDFYAGAASLFRVVANLGETHGRQSDAMQLAIRAIQKELEEKSIEVDEFVLFCEKTDNGIH